MLHSQHPEVLLSGPAGTGKSVACLFKLHLVAESVPGVRCLILRKTRASLTEAALVSFERFVLPSRHPARRGAGRTNRHHYAYPNDSVLVVGGLDKDSKALSTEYDLIYVQEAIELAESDWETLTTRLRSGKLPYQQMIADTNPDKPTHWLKRRCDAGKTTLLESRHEDNPMLWDGTAWTPRGVDYLSKLDALSGPRYWRLRKGRWVQAEGVIYDGWDASVHVVDRFPIPADWPRYWSIDFGFTNPLVVQWWAVDPDGRIYLYRELYRTGRLVEDVAREIRVLSSGEPSPRGIACDHDAEDRATLERHLKLSTVAAFKEISPGIQAVQARLRTAGDGKPRLFVLRDSLVSRDKTLDEKRQPCCLVEEIDGYIWDPKAKKGERPIDKDNHAMDAMRYMVAQLDLNPKRRLAIFA